MTISPLSPTYRMLGLNNGAEHSRALVLHAEWGMVASLLDAESKEMLHVCGPVDLRVATARSSRTGLS